MSRPSPSSTNPRARTRSWPPRAPGARSTTWWGSGSRTTRGSSRWSCRTAARCLIAASTRGAERWCSASAFPGLTPPQPPGPAPRHSRPRARHAHPGSQAPPRLRGLGATHARGPRQPPRREPVERQDGPEARDDGDDRRDHRTAEQASDARRRGRRRSPRQPASTEGSRCSLPISITSRRSTTRTDTTSATWSSVAWARSSNARSEPPTSWPGSAARNSSSCANRRTKRVRCCSPSG